ncbi:hypothetical protein [Streptomyces sp. NPDC053048]|uniref:hypothetical protein n=1 Tax=Streptomyces sp. NPDC053048 TaxID=3365694 RepID=UPI0037CD5453
MSMWGRAVLLQPAVRAVVVVLTSLVMVLSGVTSEVVEYASARERPPASSPAADGSCDEYAACVPERRVPRPGRSGRPLGGRPLALAAAAGGAGGLSGRQAPARPGDAVVDPGHARHSVLRC